MRRLVCVLLILITLPLVACNQSAPTGTESVSGPPEAGVTAVTPSLTSDPKDFLFYGPMLGGYPFGPFLSRYDEAKVAEDAGHIVTILSREEWNTKDQAYFEQFDAIVFGDQGCWYYPSYLGWASENKAWSGAITGEMIILASDPSYHTRELPLNPIRPEALPMILNGLEFAASGNGTGLYLSLGCSVEGMGPDWGYPEPPGPFTIDLLSELGNFQAINSDNEDCREEDQDVVHILEPSHPAMNGLTDEGLSHWWCTAHAFFTSYPTEIFHVLAESNRPLETDAYYPFILATPGVQDTDGDGVLDDADMCEDTTIPESVPEQRLGVNRFALADTTGVFATVSPNGRGPEKTFTIEDTAGCSCEQIIDELGLGKGHRKFGCSISAMEDWVALVVAQ